MVTVFSWAFGSVPSPRVKYEVSCVFVRSQLFWRVLLRGFFSPSKDEVRSNRKSKVTATFPRKPKVQRIPLRNVVRFAKPINDSATALPKTGATRVKSYRSMDGHGSKMRVATTQPDSRRKLVRRVAKCRKRGAYQKSSLNLIETKSSQNPAIICGEVQQVSSTSSSTELSDQTTKSSVDDFGIDISPSSSSAIHRLPDHNRKLTQRRGTASMLKQRVKAPANEICSAAMQKTFQKLMMTSSVPMSRGNIIKDARQTVSDCTRPRYRGNGETISFDDALHDGPRVGLPESLLNTAQVNRA